MHNEREPSMADDTITFPSNDSLSCNDVIVYQFEFVERIALGTTRRILKLQGDGTSTKRAQVMGRRNILLLRTKHLSSTACESDAVLKQINNATACGGRWLAARTLETRAVRTRPQTKHARPLDGTAMPAKRRVPRCGCPWNGSLHTKIHLGRH